MFSRLNCIKFNCSWASTPHPNRTPNPLDALDVKIGLLQDKNTGKVRMREGMGWRDRGTGRGEGARRAREVGIALSLHLKLSEQLKLKQNCFETVLFHFFQFHFSCADSFRGLTSLEASPPTVTGAPRHGVPRHRRPTISMAVKIARSQPISGRSVVCQIVTAAAR